ncbi:hypothetical protein NF556_15795 [Ornithinimicrobium faecis]|uniref:Uncharacterized protein n=1 Tax=Ornithinimicrobium faecis TaxID=2934158 RepID=A0ABY4YRR1_9MICO|nr:hypothetical protein [Ornithinimicrobium sp. HY1793]USQ79068.1 hypothetical protein NF556_15795 [Ornithinimicrobium sp. HY1793]
MQHYLRIESAAPNQRGRHPGIFALLVGLRQSGRLSAADEVLAERLVERSYELHDEPPESVFDTEPRANSWFIESADSASADLRQLSTEVVALLERHGISCREVRCTHPGRVTYEDALQVVAVPRTSADWPL